MSQQQPRRLELSEEQVAQARQHINDKVLTPIEIKSLLANMDDSKRRHASMRFRNRDFYIKKIEQENAELLYNYPDVFRENLKDHPDPKLMKMMKYAIDVKAGRISIDEANARVSEMLNQEFVQPVLNRLPQPQPGESYGDYARRTGQA